jgi:anti-sigma regulatory factor (Ser/Thr protein kinase)
MRVDAGGAKPPSRHRPARKSDRDTGSQQTVVELASDPQSVGLARSAVIELLRRHGRDHAVDVASLLTSELVTNAVIHGGTAVGLYATLTDARLRVEAFDRSTALPRPRNAPLDAVDGRGLLVVARLATDWGYDVGPDGKSVWFELAL